jgi:Zn ribbon nucleic-acid-binding protein
MATIPTAASARCPKCKTALTLLEWSESARENETTYLWRCTFCGHEFETKSNLVEKEPPEAELAEEFLPDLVIE